VGGDPSRPPPNSKQRNLGEEKLNANDGGNEGTRQRTKPFRAVLLHAEALAGPLDTGFCLMNLWKSFNHELPELTRIFK